MSEYGRFRTSDNKPNPEAISISSVYALEKIARLLEKLVEILEAKEVSNK